MAPHTYCATSSTKGTCLVPAEIRLHALFDAGRVVATPGAVQALDRATGQTSSTISRLLWRHVNGDWGNLPYEDAQENDDSVDASYRIISVYSVVDEVVWVITEADRSSTTVLLPNEY